MIHLSLVTTICTTACDTFNPSLNNLHHCISWDPFEPFHNHVHHCMWHIQSITQPCTPLYVTHSIHHSTMYTTVCDTFNPSLNHLHHLVSWDRLGPFHNHLHHCMWYIQSITQPSTPLYVIYSVFHTTVYFISHDTFQMFQHNLHHFILCSTSEPILFLFP